MQEHILTTNKSDRPKRRSYTQEFKAELVAQCNRGEQSLAQIAMDHQINANMLRKWQREAHQKPVNKALLPVNVVKPASLAASPGVIEIAIGSTIVRFNGPIDPDNASTILNLLR